MYNNLLKFVYEKGYSRSVHIAAAFFLGLLIGGVGMFAVSTYQIAQMPESEDEGSLKETASTFMPHAEPVRIRIPSVGIDALFEEPLSVDGDGAIEVPDGFDTVGWYKHGPTPGEQGPAVVLGHVDSYEGPEVFYPLRRLQIGDELIIERADGSIARFLVTKRKEYSQDSFPTEAVYGDLPYAGLRLITCSGWFDRGTRRYSHNLVVFAELATE